MTTGLDGKVMAYDGENRPLSVSFAGKTTSYVYGADGARLKKVESDPVTGQASVTLYLGAVEIRKYGQGAAEEILLYPLPARRLRAVRSPLKSVHRTDFRARLTPTSASPGPGPAARSRRR